MPFDPVDKSLYAYWRQAIENKAAGIPIQVPVDSPRAGYYYWVSGDKKVPVAIWWKPDETLLCKVGPAMNQDGLKRWNAFGGNPITQAVYKAVMETGQWPEEPAARPNAPEGEVGVDVELDQLVEEATGWMKAHSEIKDQATADKTQSYVARLRNVRTKAEEAHKVEKQPSLDAGRVVDYRWKPRVAKAEVTIKGLLATLTGFLKAQQAEKNQIAAQHGVEVRKASAGADNIVEGKRRATTLQTVYTPEVVDPEAAAKHYCNNEKILEIVAALALKEYRASGNAPPGVKIHKSEEAK